jgi:hypothetical protein
LCQTQQSPESKGWAPRTKGPYLMYPSKQVADARTVYGCMQFHWLLHPLVLCDLLRV